MAQDLRILITAGLNTGASIGEINTALKGIQKKLDTLQLKVNIGQDALKAINTFSNNVNKLQLKMDVHANTKPAEDAIKQITRTSAKYTAESINEAKQQLRTAFGNDSIISTQAFKNSKDQLRSFIVDVKDAQGVIQRVNYEARLIGKGDNKQLTYVSTWIQEMNMAEAELKKLTQLQEKLRAQLQAGLIKGNINQDTYNQLLGNVNKASNMDELKALQNANTVLKARQDANNSLVASQEKVTQSLKKMYDQGLVNEKFFQNFNKLINSTKNVEEINKVSNALERVNAVSKNQNLQQSMLTQAQHLLGTGSSKLDVNGLTTLINDLRSLSPTAADSTRRLSEMQTQLNGYSSAVGHAHESTLTFGNALRQAFAAFSLWSLTAQMVYAPVRALQDMSQRLIDIDTQMTEIKRVMNEPDYKFVDMLQSAVETSDQLSSKLNDVLTSMAGFARMGFSDNQLVDISKTSQILQNISDLDAQGSVDTLTSAMLNFNIAAKDSITIADKLNEVKFSCLLI
jgi:DNA repair exonuclease SbcCD ATPase subunit